MRKEVYVGSNRNTSYCNNKMCDNSKDGDCDKYCDVCTCQTYKKYVKTLVVPYCLVIESKEEHLFLAGLFNASQDIAKQHCNNYNDKLNFKFYQEVTKEL